VLKSFAKKLVFSLIELAHREVNDSLDERGWSKKLSCCVASFDSFLRSTCWFGGWISKHDESTLSRKAFRSL